MGSQHRTASTTVQAHTGIVASKPSGRIWEAGTEASPETLNLNNLIMTSLIALEGLEDWDFAGLLDFFSNGDDLILLPHRSTERINVLKIFGCMPTPRMRGGGR